MPMVRVLIFPLRDGPLAEKLLLQPGETEKDV